MRHSRLWLAAVLVAATAPARAQTTPDRGPYARIAVLRPHDGKTVDFEAGYIRHLEFHRQAKDAWMWYGWTVWAGERQRSFVYATFGHSAAALDNPVPPAEDERDNVANVAPHAEFAGNALYEFLPGLSRGSGTGEPQALARLELTTVDLRAGDQRSFEAALAAVQPGLPDETLWYRMLAGGPLPRYVRLRPKHSLAAVLAASEPALPAAAFLLASKITVEILSLRPTLSYRLPQAEAN
jgi:hypothetical protein